jgi:hypothetical protein
MLITFTAGVLAVLAYLGSGLVDLYRGMDFFFTGFLKL